MLDTFLIYEPGQDRTFVRQILKELRRRGLNVGFEESECAQQEISDTKTVSVCIGTGGFNKLERRNLTDLIKPFIQKETVIPILLPGVTEIPDDLPFLKNFDKVSFYEGINNEDAMDELEFLLTGTNIGHQGPYEIIATVIAPKKSCFIAMPQNDGDHIQQLIIEAAQLAGFRPVLAKYNQDINYAIRSAEVVVVPILTRNNHEPDSNVIYELGQAYSTGKPLIIITTQNGNNLPASSYFWQDIKEHLDRYVWECPEAILSHNQKFVEQLSKKIKRLSKIAKYHLTDIAREFDGITAYNYSSIFRLQRVREELRTILFFETEITRKFRNLEILVKALLESLDSAKNDYLCPEQINTEKIKDIEEVCQKLQTYQEHIQTPETLNFLGASHFCNITTESNERPRVSTSWKMANVQKWDAPNFLHRTPLKCPEINKAFEYLIQKAKEMAEADVSAKIEYSHAFHKMFEVRFDQYQKQNDKIITNYSLCNGELQIMCIDLNIKIFDPNIWQMLCNLTIQAKELLDSIKEIQDLAYLIITNLIQAMSETEEQERK